MKKIKINKKIIITVIAFISFLIIFFVFVSVKAQTGIGGDPTISAGKSPAGPALNPASNAGSWLSDAISGVAAWFFRLLGTIFIFFGRLLLNTAVNFFETMLTEGFNGRPAIVSTGWTVTRDIANMFFILIMVVIAFATILRFEKYGVKQLLPKLIVVALLINFSMILCFVLIDLTNIAANFFITNAQNNNGVTMSLSAIFLDGLQVTRTLTAAFCEQYLIDEEECATQFGASEEPMDAAICQRNAHTKYEQCDEQMTAIAENESENESLLHVIVSQLGSAAILFIAAFIIFAGGIILVIRSVMIWFLVIIAPLAFILNILPSLRKYWEEWMQQFTRWCLFAPIYAFFIWLASRICVQGTIERVSALQSNAFIEDGGAVTQFFSDVKYIYNFIFIGAFLVGGLIAANKMGISGASAAMSVGKKWTNSAKGWAKKQTMKPVKGAAQRVGAGAAIVGGGIRAWAGKTIGGRFGRRMEAKGTATKQSAAEQTYNKKYEAMLKTMSGENLLKEVKSAKGSKALIAARAAQSRGLLKTDATKQEAKAAANAFKAYGATDAARQLEESRLDIIDGVEALAQTIKRLATEGNLDKVSAASFATDPSDPGSAARVTRAVIENTNSAQQESLIKRSKQHADNWEKSLEQMTAPVTPGTTRTAAQEEMTHMDAANQEKTHKAYATKSGDIDRMTIDMLKGWAQKAGPDGIKNLKSTSDPIRISIVAQNIPTNQLATAVEKMSDDVTVKEVIRHLKGLNPALLTTNPNALANHNAAMNNPALKDLA